MEVSTPGTTTIRTFEQMLQLRAVPRVGADYEASVFSRDFRGGLAARTRDLGIGGVCIATASPFSFQSVHRVVLVLPNGKISLEAKGLWQRVEHAGQVILTGIEFLEPDPGVIDQLWDLVMDGGKLLARFLHGDSDLAHLSPDEAVGVAHASRWRDVPAGRYVYRSDVQRSGEASIFIVLSGHVILQLRLRGVSDRTLARLGPGRMFGGLSIVAEGLPGESALAHDDVRLLEIHEGAFRYLCAARPWLAQRIAHSVTLAYARRAGILLTELSEQL